MACDYSSKFLPLIVANSKLLNKTALEEWFIKSFNNGEDLYNKWIVGTLLSGGSTSNPSIVENRPYFGRFTYETQYDNISDFYRGATDLQIEAEQEFKKDIVRLTVFDRTEENPEKRWKNSTIVDNRGIAEINHVLAKYKEKLANDLLAEIGNEQPIVLSSDMSNSEFNKVIQDVLAKYRQFLSTNPSSAAKYNSFVTLSLFDEMLASYAPFIQPRKEFIDPVTRRTLKTDAYNKYEYKGPNVEHYTGYTSSEFAAIENQDSDLAKIILETIPDINEEEQPIKDSFIGLSGFNASMTAMKNWIMYSHNQLAQEARTEYYKGAKADFSKIIDLYSRHLKNSSKSVKGVYDSRSTFLISKLNSIRKYIFDPNSDYIMRAMFSNMVFKTENISYRAYSYDETSGRVSGSNLHNAYVNAQKFNVEDIVRSAEHLIRTSKVHKGEITSKYKVSYSNGSISIKKGDQEVFVNLFKDGSEIKGTFDGPASSNNTLKKEIIQDFLMYIVPDTYEQVGKTLEDASWDWTNDFAPFIAMIGYTLTNTNNNSIKRDSKTSLLDFKNWTLPVVKIAKKLSVIYGSETRNVVKNLSGSNLPSYQLTNLSYNLPSLIDDIVKDKDSVNKNSLLVEARELLIAPQVRSEVQFGNKTKSAADLSVRELLQLNVIHDFYEAFMPNNDDPGKIYLQSATYADKSTHYLFGYDLNQNIQFNGNNYNLFELIKAILSNDVYIDSTTNKKLSATAELVNIIRTTRANRINNIVNNILEDYRTVFPNETLNTLEDLQNFLENKTYDYIVNAFAKEHIEFYEEVHGTKPKYKGAPSIALNETLVMQYETFNNPSKFEQRLNNSRQAFINSIDDAHWKWNKYDNPIFKTLFDNKDFESFKGQNGYINTHIGNKLHPILEAYFLTDVLLSNEINSIIIGEVFAHPNKNKRQTNIPITWAVSSENGYEVSSQGDSRFSAHFAKFKPGTILFGHNVGGRTIESVYQHGIKQNDWITDNNNKTGAPKSNEIIHGNTSDDSYRDGYLPLWQEWAKQNPELIEDLRKKSIGKVLTDKFTSNQTTVSQARALADILNETNNNEFGTYDEFSEANRLIAQIKRSVAFGATWHPYLQGLNNGVASQIKVAVVEDMKGIVFTPNGDENDDLDSMDGSGVAHPIQSRFENNSLVDAKVGANKKSIMMDVNTRLGLPTLLKWAVYELSNEVRRNGYFTNASAEQLYRKMSLGNLREYVSISQLNDALQRYGDIIFKSYRNLKNDTPAIKYYRIVGFTNSENTGIKQQLVEVNSKGEETGITVERTLPLETLYDFDQALGGAFTGTFENGVWTYNEANLDVLEGLLSTTTDNRKTTFISYVVNKSAIKVGAGAVNPSSVWNRNNSSELNYFWMKSKYGGVQMDADHELDLAEVTEMTQMISALIEDGHYKDLVETVYKDIGGVVASHMAKLNAAINDILQTGSYEAKQELYKILAQSWINSFEKGDKDTIGIAQAFVKKVSDAFKKGEYTAQIPFSAATINGSFVSNVISSINKGGIRHKYEGFAGVLNPSHNMIQYYRVWNNDALNEDGSHGNWEVRLFDEFADFCINKGIPINIRYLEGLVPGVENNPLLVELPNNRIDFEDTIVLVDKNGSFVAFGNDKNGNPVYTKYIDSFEAYDDLKALLRKNDYKAYVHTGYGRNLKGTNTWFTINGKEYSMYDLDSVRTSQYLWKVLSQPSQEKFEKALNTIPFDKLSTIQRTLGWRFDYEFLKANPKSAKEIIGNLIKRSNAKTQEILKSIENGEEFEASEAFGITNPTVTENGSPIQYTSAHIELQNLGARKNVDSTSTIEALSNPAIAAENPAIANWLIKLIQDSNAIDSVPDVGLSESIKQNIQNVRSLKTIFENMRTKDPEFNKWTVVDRAKAITAYYDALHNLIARICDQVFDIDVKWNLRRLSSAEVKTPWSVRADSYHVDAAEIITGRYQWEKFGLGENDHIFNLTSQDSFYKINSNRYSDPSYINTTMFDIAMWGNGEEFLVKFGELPEITEGLLSESNDFVEIDGNIYFNGIKVGSSQNKKFWTYVDIKGQKHNIIQVNTADDFREIKKSSVFDNVIHYYWNEDNFETLKKAKYGDEKNVTIFKDKKIKTTDAIENFTLKDFIFDENVRFDRRLWNQSKDQYDSFIRQLYTIGARIPTQAMQSFMAMKTIAVTRTKQNAVYVPKTQTYLQGSDYDIDKLYILAHSVNSNGLVQIGSPLQKTYGLDFVSKLRRAEGKDIVVTDDPNKAAYTVSAKFIFNFYNDLVSKNDIIKVYNGILNANGPIYFNTTMQDPDGSVHLLKENAVSRTVNRIIREVQDHEKAVLKSTSDPNYLKNRVTSVIFDITTKLQNQLIAQVPVDMGDPKKAAEASTLGKAELHINSDNPATKFMMQMQNMIGKKVIGISAVSLKAFFGLSYYYSDLTDNLKKVCEGFGNTTSETDIISAIEKLVFVHPITGELTSLANIDIEQVLDVIKHDSRFRNISVPSTVKLKIMSEKSCYDNKTGTFDLIKFCKLLRERVNVTDAALTDSAIISAATDNAKELILAKINATPELVDIYTYLTAVGTPFLNIAKFMTSKSFGFITSAGTEDIFDMSAQTRKVKATIDWFLNKKLLGGTNRMLLEQLLPSKYDSEGNIKRYADIDFINELSNENTIDNLLNTLNKYLEQPIFETGYAYDQAREALEQNGLYYQKYWGVDRFSEEEIRNLIKVLEWEKEKIEFKKNLENQNIELNNVEKISAILPKVEEMTMMGGAQGINQGQRTDLYSNRAFVKRINDYIRRRQKDTKDTFEQFSFEQFVIDEEYRKMWIDHYNDLKETFNVLEALTTLPHFWEMLKTTISSKTAIQMSSWRDYTLYNVADAIELENENCLLSQDDWKTMDHYLNDFLIGAFLKESGFTFYLPTEVSYYSGFGLTGKLENKVNGYPIKLNSVTGAASFKLFIEEVVIPKLKTNINFASNKFVSSLVPHASLYDGDIRTGWKLPLDMMTIDASPNTKLLFSEILRDFTAIANQTDPISGMKIGDLFYLYNMIINKDSYSRNSLLRLFENIINNDDTSSIAFRFNDFISKLDSGEITLDEKTTNDIKEEAIYRLKKANPNLNVESKINTNLKLPGDITLDLPRFFLLPVEIKDKLSYTDSSKHSIDYGTTDALLAVVQNIAQKYNANVEIITDDDLENGDFSDNAKNAKAFIKNGTLYFNINRASASDGIHELAHIVLASMKFNEDSNIRNMYYNLVTKMKDPNIVPKARFNEIISMYVGNDGIVTSDILEEVLANELASYLDGELRQETKRIMTIDVETSMLNAITDALDFNRKLNIKDIEGKSLIEILQAVSNTILNTKSINSDFVYRSQRVAALKDYLIENERLMCK